MNCKYKNENSLYKLLYIKYNIIYIYIYIYIIHIKKYTIFFVNIVNI